MDRKLKVFLLVLVILIIDQASKIYIKTNFYYHEMVPIFGLDWAYLHFVENNGAAFGLSLGGEWGKLALTTFRIVTVCILAYFINMLIKRRESMGMIMALSLVFAGAIGNIIDSVFYGVIFSESGFSPEGVAIFMPPDGGYSSLFHGKVVDMFYFPMIDTYWPDWVPVIGGNSFQFFRPVFNVADSSIFVGMVILLIFYRDFFSGGQQKGREQDDKDKKEATEDIVLQSEPR